MRANERTDERVAQYFRLYSCLFQTTVDSHEDHRSLFYDEKVSLGECTAACGAHLHCLAYQYHAASSNCRHLSGIEKSIAYAGNHRTGRCWHCTHVSGVYFKKADLTGYAGLEVASLSKWIETAGDAFISYKKLFPTSEGVSERVSAQEGACEASSPEPPNE